MAVERGERTLFRKNVNVAVSKVLPFGFSSANHPRLHCLMRLRFAEVWYGGGALGCKRELGGVVMKWFDRVMPS